MYYFEGYTSSMCKEFKIQYDFITSYIIHLTHNIGAPLLICKADDVSQTWEEASAAVRGNAPPGPSDIRLKTANDLIQSPEIHLNRSALVPNGDKRAASVINSSDAAVGTRFHSDIKEKRDDTPF